MRGGVPGPLVRTARFLLRPVLPLLRRRVLRIRSGPARGCLGLAGQWSLPRRPDPEELFLRSLDYRGKTVYDVGANVGATTLFFSRQVGEGGTVVAFEPNPEVLPVLRRHLELNRCANVRVCPVAAGSVAEASRLRVPRDARGAGTLGRTIAGPHLVEHEVRQVRLDDYAAEQRLPPPDLVKVDTEGFETQCLLGLEETLARRRPALFLEVHGGSEEEKRENARSLLAVLTRHGYEAVHVETGRRLGPGDADLARRGHVHGSFAVPAPGPEGEGPRGR